MISTYARNFVVRFFLSVGLPVLFAALAVGALTVNLITRVSTGANIEDHDRTSQVVASALSSAQAQLANTATDNAHWDDAVRHLYQDPDEAWVNECYGVPTTDGVNYDVFMVADRSMAAAVTGFRKGELFKPSLDEYFAGKLNNLLDALPDDNKTSDAKGTIINTTDGLAVVAVSPILPTSEDLQIPVSKPRYLILAKLLTADRLEAIGTQYVVNDLVLTPWDAKSAPAGDVVKDFNGDPVATVQWTDRLPGDQAHAAVIPTTILTLSFLAFVLLGISGLCGRLIRDVLKREAQARHDALHDPLTGLPNRAAVSARLLDFSKGGTKNVALAFADLDGFKEVNDTYDHATGDELICRVAEGLGRLVDGNALVARLGGDEFVAVIHGPEAAERARLFADNLIAFLSVPFDLDGKMGSVGASIGIASTNNAPAEALDLMRRADIAMYKAKDSGKNRYCEFVPAFDAERQEDLAIATELRQILDEGRIEVAFQPVVASAAPNKIVGVEALARWPSSSSRRVFPDRFVHVAETQGIIDDLGDAILAKACAHAAGWPGLTLAVNVSSVQLRNPSFVSRTLQTIAENGMDPGRVEIELTEGVLVDDVEKTKGIFDRLRTAGIKIALDDFGSGFASIGYLRQLDFDRIKLDRSLVERVLVSPGHLSILQGTNLMAAGLSAKVTAEGVENKDLLQLLQLSGCSEMQGYYFSKPVPAAEIARLVSEWPPVESGAAA